MKGKEVGGRIMVHQRNQIEIGNSKRRKTEQKNEIENKK